MELPPPVLIPTPTKYQSFKILVTSCTLWNCLLFFIIPLGYLAYALKWSNTWVFVSNFLALIPLDKLSEFATEEVALRVDKVFIIQFPFYHHKPVYSIGSV